TSVATRGQMCPRSAPPAARKTNVAARPGSEMSSMSDANAPASTGPGGAGVQSSMVGVHLTSTPSECRLCGTEGERRFTDVHALSGAYGPAHNFLYQAAGNKISWPTSNQQHQMGAWRRERPKESS